MIPFEDIDRRLFLLGLDRLWLAEKAEYSEAAVREALAPNSKKRSGRLQAAITKAITDEEELRKSQKQPELLKIVVTATEEQFDRWNKAAMGEQKLIREWAAEGLDQLAAEWEREMRYPRVAEDPPVYGAKSSGSGRA